MFLKLPQEIQDDIFLLLDFETLERFRPLQSDYVKNITECGTFLDAAEFGTIENIKWLLYNKYPYDENVFAYVALRGNIKDMQWLYDNNFPRNEKTFEYACHSSDNRVELFNWLKEREFPMDIMMLENALFYSNADNLNWLKENNAPYDDDVFLAALDNGYNIECFQYLLDNYEYPEDIINILSDSKLETKCFLLENINVRTNERLVPSFEFENLSSVDWLCNYRSENFYGMNIILDAIEEHKDLEIFDYLCKIGCRFDDYTFKYAFIKRNYNVLDWFKRHIDEL